MVNIPYMDGMGCGVVSLSSGAGDRVLNLR